MAKEFLSRAVRRWGLPNDDGCTFSGIGGAEQDHIVATGGGLGDAVSKVADFKVVWAAVGRYGYRRIVWQIGKSPGYGVCAIVVDDEEQIAS